MRYNGSVPGPTLHLRPGDHLGIDLVNHLDQPTNLHTHGLQVSPQGNSDNPFVMVNPGQTFHYDYQIPDDHPAGTFWYHPHHHGLAADQVFGGLYGAIVIGEPDPTPVSADRVLVISDITLDGAGAVPPATAMQRMTGREGDLVLVNGQSRPQLTARPGARERWRIVNACVARYLRLRLDGQDLQLLGIDLPLGGRAAAGRRGAARPRQPRRPPRHHPRRNQHPANTSLQPRHRGHGNGDGIARLGHHSAADQRSTWPP